MIRLWLLLLAVTVGCGGGQMSQPALSVPPVPVASKKPPVLPVTWTVTDLPPLLGMLAAQANAVNSSGVAVGYSVDAAMMGHATQWVSGQPTELGPGIAVAINDTGLIAGYMLDSTFTVHAQLWGSGQVKDLGQWLPTAINSGGTVVGIRLTDNTAVMWSKRNGLQSVPGCSAALAISGKGTIAGITTGFNAGICGGQDYQVPGAVVALNDSGMAVGYQDLGNNQADALVFPGNDIATSALATGVNEWGWVVGEQLTSTEAVDVITGGSNVRSMLVRGGMDWRRIVHPRLSGNSQPFIWSQATGLTFLPQPLMTATDISGKRIVGAGLSTDGQSIHGVLLEGK